MEKKDVEKLKKIFEDKVLKGTCFNTLKELKEDKTDVFANAPRALIACNLMGKWEGMCFMYELYTKDLRKTLSFATKLFGDKK